MTEILLRHGRIYHKTTEAREQITEILSFVFCRLSSAI